MIGSRESKRLKQQSEKTKYYNTSSSDEDDNSQDKTWMPRSSPSPVIEAEMDAVEIKSRFQYARVITTAVREDLPIVVNQRFDAANMAEILKSHYKNNRYAEDQCFDHFIKGFIIFDLFSDL